jgi:PAS domain S-box-containing protein
VSAPFAEGAGTIVIREKRIIYASAGVALLVGLPVERIVGAGFLDIIAPDERERMADRHARRLRGEVVPAEYETALVSADGARHAVECQVTRDGADVVIQIRDTSAEAARRPRLERLAALGVALAGERSEAAVFARARAGLVDLELAALLMRAEPDGPRLAWIGAPPGVEHRFAEALGPLAGLRGRWTRFSRAVWDDGVAYSDEWGSEVEEALGPPRGGAARALVAVAGFTHGAAVRLDERAGPASYLVLAGSWLRRGDLAAVRLFGAQVAAALDAARTIADLSRHNADLAALNAIGRLAGEGGTLASFFARAAAVVEHTCGATGLAVHVGGEEGELVRAWPPAPGAVDEAALAPVWAEALRERVPRVVERDGGEPARAETWAVVPLVARSKAVGVMSVTFPARAPDARGRLDLLASAAAHLAAAIEADGLLGDLRRRVAELTLLNDLAMASATLDPVLLLDNALRRVCETFGADHAGGYLREGDRLSLVAAVNAPPELVRTLAGARVGRGPPGLAVERLSPVVVDDPEGHGPQAAEVMRALGVRHGVAVPLLAKSEALGALVLGRTSDRPFAAGDVTLLSAIGVQLGVAVENARLFAATRRRLRDMESIHALALRIFENAPGDVKALLEDGCREAVRTLAGRGGVVFLLSGDGATLTAAAVHGAPLPAARLSLPVDRDRMAEDAVRRRVPARSEDVSKDPRSAMFGRPEVPPLAMLAVPLAARDAVRGVLFVADDAGRRFTDAELALAQALASELALGIENAEVYLETRRRAEELGVLQESLRLRNAELERAQQQIATQERLAALGELSAIVAHEVRNPLGVIFNSLGTLRRLLRPQGDARVLLDIVGEEADRLNRIVGDLLDFARPSTPVLRPEPLDRVVDDAVQAALAQRPPGIELVREADPALAEVPVDARLVRQAVINLAVNAVQAMPRGGRLTVRTRLAGDRAVLEVADTGTGIPPEVRPRIFEPFFTTKASGTGLGLAVVKRILDGHGGEVAVSGGPGGGTVFQLRFPANMGAG